VGDVVLVPASADPSPPVVTAPAPVAQPPAAPPPVTPPAPRTGAVVPAFTRDILKREPAIGQLPTGASVLVDDGTCPAGQIKQVVGGNVATGQPRLRSCVARP
jgi:hypothetical protein